MYKPLVSIIVPIYNVEKYLPRAIDNLINQSYSNLEIILVDDGSPDNCPLICDEYAQKDTRIVVIHKKNGGLSEARNIGILKAKGEYIYFLDSDDYVSLDTFYIMVNEMLNSNADIVCSGFNVIDDNNRLIEAKKLNSNLKLNGKECTKRLLLDQFPYNYAWGKLYKKELFRDIQFPIRRLYEDIATIYKVTSKANSVVCLSECLYNYEQGRPGNISSELKSEKAALSYFHGCLNSLEHIKFCTYNKEYEELIPFASDKLFSWSKLCIDSAIKGGKEIYKKYHQLVIEVLKTSGKQLPFRLKIILLNKNLYYHIYPLIGKNR